MNAQKAIHERWQTYKPLTDLIPRSNIFTGNVPAELAENEDGTIRVVRYKVEKPFAQLLVMQTQKAWQSSHNFCTREMVKFVVYSESYDQARQIADLVFKRFSGAAFNFRGGRVLNMLSTGRNEMDDGDTQTRMVEQSFTVLVEVSKQAA